MSWQLTTPVDVGDLDASNYAELKIRRLYWDDERQTVNVGWEYGNTVDGDWVRGMKPHDKVVEHLFEGQGYTDLVSHATNDGELTYASVKRGIYEALLSLGLIDAGTIV